MAITDYVALLGGVALFLFGMTLMGDGLKKVAGNRLELVLYRLTGTPAKGVLLGALVTAVIQSSSATSVMVVGFVNSGMMKLAQAISVIQGALVGTSITGWIIALSAIGGGNSGWASLLSTSSIAAIVAVVGVILRMFAKKQTSRHLGDILLGFSVLMFGMKSMSGAVEPLHSDPFFLSMLTSFSHPLLGILVGALFTAVLQSASAAVGILQALSLTGAVTFATAYPLILGIAIGSALPVLISALGAKVDGRRAAFSYLLIEILGVLIFGVLYYALNAVFHFGLDNWIVGTVAIAAVNTIFRLLTSLLLLPFDKQLEKISALFIKESEEEKSALGELDRLDERFLEHPALALEQSRLTVNAMSKTVKENLLRSLSLFRHYSDDVMRRVEKTEDLIDLYEDKLGTYLIKLNANELNQKQNENAAKYLHTLSDFERIGDHAMNIAERAREMHDKKLSFSSAARHEMEVLEAALREIMDLSFDAFANEDLDKAFQVEPLEERIDVLCDEMKIRHVERLKTGECSLNQGFVFNDLLTDFERVSDHCSNLAVAMIELQDDTFDAHGYIINLKELHANNFDALYEQYAKKYVI